MTNTEKQIINFLDMIPFFSPEKKRDFVLKTMPILSQENKEMIYLELKELFQKLVSQVSVTAFAQSNLSEKVKIQILEIEREYLQSLKTAGTGLLHEFLGYEQQVRNQEFKAAEKMLKHYKI